MILIQPRILQKIRAEGTDMTQGVKHNVHRTTYITQFFPMARQPQWAMASSLLPLRDHNQSDTPQSGLPWTSDRYVAETSN